MCAICVICAYVEQTLLWLRRSVLIRLCCAPFTSFYLHVLPVMECVVLVVMVVVVIVVLVILILFTVYRHLFHTLKFSRHSSILCLVRRMQFSLCTRNSFFIPAPPSLDLSSLFRDGSCPETFCEEHSRPREIHVHLTSSRIVRNRLSVRSRQWVLISR